MPRFVDLSLPLANGVAPTEELSVEYYDHAYGAGHMERIFGVEASQLPGGLGWAGERVLALTHAGTHMDAPYHYAPKCGSAPSRTIDQIPIEWCVGPAVVLRFRDKADGELISVDDIKRALAALSYQLQPGDIVLIETGRCVYYGTPEYARRGPGMSAEATRTIVDAGVKVIGIDTWGFDLPFAYMRDRFEATRDPATIWPAHYVGRELEYLQLERLTNLQHISCLGARVFCFPIKIQAAGGAWCRVVAEVFD